ncbi:MAG: hypothetical protein A2W85_05560 [Bacteroidetes bacterium GWF2_41_31]|nr:MAG: hypothetical protein A2W85_05560 [Bacteroidetes bacterium GWF2_41_31]
MEFIVFYSSTMNVFIGHPLQSGFSRLQVNQIYSLISRYLLDISSIKANYYLREMIGYPVTF